MQLSPLHHHPSLPFPPSYRTLCTAEKGEERGRMDGLWRIKQQRRAVAGCKLRLSAWPTSRLADCSCKCFWYLPASYTLQIVAFQLFLPLPLLPFIDCDACLGNYCRWCAEVCWCIITKCRDTQTWPHPEFGCKCGTRSEPEGWGIKCWSDVKIGDFIFPPPPILWTNPLDLVCSFSVFISHTLFPHVCVRERRRDMVIYIYI